MITGNNSMPVAVCKLCDGMSLEGDDEKEIEHDTNCPLNFAPTTGVTVSICTAPWSEVCIACPADGGVNCMVASDGGWEKCWHEKILTRCGRYAADVARART
jgi:hypothetical protein